MERVLKRRKARRNLLADPDFLAMHTPEQRLRFATCELLNSLQTEINEIVTFCEAVDEDPTHELAVTYQLKRLDKVTAMKISLEKVKEAFGF